MRTLIVGACAIVALVATGCTDNQDAAGARELLRRVREAEYRSWARAPGYDARAPSRAAHGDEVDIFVNDVVDVALAEPALDAWPAGSIVVKDGYTDRRGLAYIAILEKRADGWFYAEFGDDGEPKFSGRPALCVGCHALGDDFIRAFYFPPGNAP